MVLCVAFVVCGLVCGLSWLLRCDFGVVISVLRVFGLGWSLDFVRFCCCRLRILACLGFVRFPI